MAHAVTHIILTIVLIDLFRDYVLKKKFPTWIVLVGGIAGLLPDIDIVYSVFYNSINHTGLSFHGGITHSIIFPLIFLVVGLLFYFKGLEIRLSKINIERNKNLYITLFVISFGLFFHLVLDCMFSGYPTLLHPFCACNICPQWNIQSLAPAIDSIILIFWLVHEEIRHKIKDYI